MQMHTACLCIKMTLLIGRMSWWNVKYKYIYTSYLYFLACVLIIAASYYRQGRGDGSFRVKFNFLDDSRRNLYKFCLAYFVP